jgi:hypothetical protein
MSLTVRPVASRREAAWWVARAGRPIPRLDEETLYPVPIPKVVVLSELEASWVLPAALLACGVVFLGDAAAESGQRKHDTVTFVLNLFSLPIGGLTFVVGGLDAYHARALTTPLIAVLIVGAVLIGRSLREVPWTGAFSLLVAAAAGWFFVTHSPWMLTTLQLLAITGGLFLVVFLVLYMIELPFRIVGLVALPRIFLLGLAAASFLVAAFVFFVGVG